MHSSCNRETRSAGVLPAVAGPSREAGTASPAGEPAPQRVRRPRCLFALALFLLLVSSAAAQNQSQNQDQNQSQDQSQSRSQNPEAQPAALNKQRTALLARAAHAPLTAIESDVNRLAVLSETCRVEHGSQACGLPDKPLDSSKLEDRYAYYVKQPLDSQPKPQGPKIDRRNWKESK